MRQTAHNYVDSRDLSESREAERTALGRRGVLRIGNHLQPFDVFVRDLTRDGCGIQGDAPVEPGMIVQIGIANLGSTPATVLWHRAGSFGCMFNRPLPSGSVTAALGPLNVVPFPSDAAPAASLATCKMAPRARLLVLVASTALCWSAIGAMVLTFA